LSLTLEQKLKCEVQKSGSLKGRCDVRMHGGALCRIEDAVSETRELQRAGNQEHQN